MSNCVFKVYAKTLIKYSEKRKGKQRYEIVY